MSRSRADRGKQKTLDKGPTEQTKEGKRPGAEQRAEVARARDQEQASKGLWERIFESRKHFAALERVARNGGAPGIDGMPGAELRLYLKEHWLEIRETLDQQTYRPSPVRLKEIEKPDEGGRGLGIPTVTERCIQQAITQVLRPLFEPLFTEHSYGFRPGRSAHQGVKQAQEYVQAGYEWSVDLDLEEYFDRVNHDILMARTARVVKDKRVLKLIRAYLESGRMDHGVVRGKEEGVPQGSPLSRLLSNVMLDDLANELEKRGHKCVRYADDGNIYVKTPRAGERVMESGKRFLEKKLKLKVNPKKSKVDRAPRVKFLGCSRYQYKGELRIRVAKRSLERLREKLRRLTKRTRSGRLADIIQEINRYTIGGMGYYRLAKTPSIYGELDSWIRRRLRQLIWKRWKRGPTRYRELRKLGVPQERARLGAVGKSPWNMSKSPVINEALSNTYLRNSGLKSVKDRYQELCLLS